RNASGPSRSWPAPCCCWPARRPSSTAGPAPTAPPTPSRPPPDSPSAPPRAAASAATPWPPPSSPSLPAWRSPSSTRSASSAPPPGPPPPAAPEPAALAWLDEVQGDVRLQSGGGSRAAVQGQGVPAGGELTAHGEDAAAVLRYADGSRLEVGPGSRVRLE